MIAAALSSVLGGTTASQSGLSRPKKGLAIDQLKREAGVDCLFWFLSADRLKTYCLYQASDPSALKKAAEKAYIPIDQIVEVSRLQPPAFNK